MSAQIFSFLSKGDKNSGDIVLFWSVCFERYVYSELNISMSFSDAIQVPLKFS